MDLSKCGCVWVCFSRCVFSGQKQPPPLTKIWKSNYRNECVQGESVHRCPDWKYETASFLKKRKNQFLQREVCLCDQLNLNMIRQRWKSIIIWIIIYSVQPCRVSALTQQQECVHRPSQFPPDYNDAGSYLFSPAVRLFSFFFIIIGGRNCSFYWWQAIWKCPCWIVTGAMLFWISAEKNSWSAAGTEGSQKSIHGRNACFYVAISRLEFLVTQMFYRSSAGVQPHEKEAKNCSVCSWSAI